jgi:hypothetical protein
MFIIMSIQTIKKGIEKNSKKSHIQLEQQKAN